jgi:thiamine-phosphate pyrophosphorylase
MPLLDNLRRPILCYVSDRRILTKTTESEASHAVLQVIEAAASAGVDWIQVREKDLSAREYSWLISEAMSRTMRSQIGNPKASRIIANDRLRVVLAEGADGIHLGEVSSPLKEIRSALDEYLSQHPGKSQILIGSSCHSIQSAAKAASDGADYIFFGPVFATPSKAKFGSPQGLDRLAEVSRAVTIPVLAIGGITLENASSCLVAGASGLAGIRLFQDAPNISTVVETLRNLPA